MRLNDAITFIDIGECPVDMDIALKTFTKRCFISKYHDNYRLVRITHKKCVSMKVTISKKDAFELISKLELMEHGSEVFNYGSTFVMKEVNPLRI